MEEVWKRANRTELYQACVRSGIRAPPGATKQELYDYLIGKVGCEEGNPVDSWRDTIMAFMIAYWKKVRLQVTCPAKTKDPKACYGCLDIQVIDCIVESPTIEEKTR